MTQALADHTVESLPGDDESPKRRFVEVIVHLWDDEAFRPVHNKIGNSDYVTPDVLKKLDKIRKSVYPHGADAHVECMPGSRQDFMCRAGGYIHKKMRVFEGDDHGISWLKPEHFDHYEKGTFFSQYQFGPII